ncbi:MAG: hypothetical protein IKZ37_06265 [Bacteroidaceae bacterium]|nr:hypothetical protein [Bacteroidaceae bacterium]
MLILDADAYAVENKFVVAVVTGGGDWWGNVAAERCFVGCNLPYSVKSYMFAE